MRNQWSIWISCGIARIPLCALVSGRPWLSELPVSDTIPCQADLGESAMTMPERLNDTEREKATARPSCVMLSTASPRPEVARRVRERGAEITRRIYASTGEIDPETSGNEAGVGPGDLGSWILTDLAIFRLEMF